MKQKKILTLTLSQLKQLYKQELPALISIAQNSPNEEKFKIQLNAFIDTIPTNNTQEIDIRERLFLFGCFVP